MKATIFVMGLVWSCGVFATDEHLSLSGAVALAAAHSPNIDATQAAVDAAHSLVIPAGQLPDPELIVGVDSLPITGADAGSLSADFMTMRKIGVMQSFPRSAKRNLRSQRASDEVRTSEAKSELTELEVKRQTADAWIATYVAEETVRRLNALESDFELQTRIANAGVSNGRLSSADALAAQVSLIEFRDRIHVAEQSAHRARAELARWLPEDANRPLNAPPNFDTLPIASAQLLTDMNRHAALVVFDAKLAAARTDIALAQADKRPDWSVELSYAKRGPAFSDMASLQFHIGLPIFSSHRQDPVIAEKRTRLREIEAEREAELRMHMTEVSQVIIDWQTLKTRVNSYQQELMPLAHTRTQTALAAFQAAQTLLKPVLDAQAAEIDMQLRSIELEGQLGRAWAFLSYLQN